MFIDGVGDAPIHNTLLSIITIDSDNWKILKEWA